MNGTFVKYRYLDNKNSILYGEFPFHILCKYLHCSESKVYRKFITLCQCTNYIKKHDLVYSDVKYTGKEHQKEYVSNPEHYLKKDYKSFAKNKYYKMNDIYGNPFEINHPRVTPFSCIIFIDKLKETKTGKRVLRKIDMYKDLVYYTIINNSGDPNMYKKQVYLNNDTKLGSEYQETYMDIFSNYEDETELGIQCQEEEIQNFADEMVYGNKEEGISGYGRFLAVDTLKKQHHTYGEMYIKRLKIFGNAKERSMESLIKFYIKIIRQFTISMVKDFKYYLNLMTKLVDIVAQKLYECFANYITDVLDIKNKIKISKVYNLIQHYDTNHGIKLLSNLEQQVRDKILNSEWYYNLGYRKEEIYGLMNINYINESIPEEAINSTQNNTDINTDVYENGVCITDNFKEDNWLDIADVFMI